MAPTPPIPALEPAFDVEARLGPLEDHGMTRAGHRRVIPVAGGTITGQIEGTLLAGGADWQVVRADGSIEINGHYSARTNEGELLLIHSVGVRSGAPAVLEALLHGEQVDPSEYYFRTAVTIETSASRLREFEASLYVTSCVREADAVRYTAYRVT
ncbi:DUF3237 domain-containing protein [Microbacterium sp. LRZ72]|uniref:DUF3237 domain-containing protein n=1 Tax=Microbacterium sp. LRZ72 TaxID=2942481 RepID=UPI0029A39191|nr:DUF3237 domain-containing protein [Microbacterium sp. LRZ72]MDX2376460.1 DUF3237 domain-containing protein [Microbacterium sp. LRZ72]